MNVFFTLVLFGLLFVDLFVFEKCKKWKERSPLRVCDQASDHYNFVKTEI